MNAHQNLGYPGLPAVPGKQCLYNHKASALRYKILNVKGSNWLRSTMFSKRLIVYQFQVHLLHQPVKVKTDFIAWE